jgi:ubiquinone/menaquinone biosynthesis C-methylase UbiE
MNANKALWEKGDFTDIAAFMRESGEAVAKSMGITPSLKVLDLGCGDGTTAMPMAIFGADVTGIDIASNLVEAGNNRAEAAGLDRLKFREGDACNLEGVPDQSFDLTLSVFGAMFAPRPFDVAKEMVRVTKPGGRVMMVKDTFHFKSPDKTPADFIDLFSRFYGPTMNAYDAAEKNGKREDLHNQLVELARAQNQSKNGGTSIPATFLRVTVSL